MRATAVLLNYPPNRFIGAELATHALLRYLQKAGWDVKVITHTPPGAPQYGTIPVRPIRQITPFTVTEGDYPSPQDTFLLVHSYVSPQLLAPLLDAHQRHGTPVVLYAHSSRDHTKRAIQIINPDFIIPNSHATARALHLPQDQTVRPPLELPRLSELATQITAAKRPNVAGYVNSTLIKGGDLLRQLTAQLSASSPYDTYGINGGYGDQLAPGRPSLSHENMSRDYYSRIGVHLQLSLSESYGLSALEALSHGVPVISTDLPGPREALHRIPHRFLHWLPAPPSPDYSPRYLDLLIRYVLALPTPSRREIRTLISALRDTSRAADTDRKLMERYLRNHYA